MNKDVICAFARVNRCTALIDKVCNKCPFFKTEEELKRSRQKSDERIKALPNNVQSEIHSKYYAKKVII